MSSWHRYRSRDVSTTRGPSWHFAARWLAAVAMSLAVTGLAEQALTARAVEHHVLQESADAFERELRQVQGALDDVDVPPTEQDANLREVVRRITDLDEIPYAALVDLDGAVVTDWGVRNEDLSRERIRAVLSSGRAHITRQDDARGNGDPRYRFLLPLPSSQRAHVLQVDQFASALTPNSWSSIASS